MRAWAPGFQEGKSEATIQSGGKHFVTVALERIGEGKISVKALSDLRGVTGQEFQATFEARGGTPNYSWKVTGGSLPSGLGLVSPPMPMSPCLETLSYPSRAICPQFKQTTIWLTGVPTQAGTYKFELTAADSQGNRGSETFVAVISGETQANRPPVIHGVSGPVVLKVNETGTWTVKASDPENQGLSYSVIWGDETPLPMAVQSAPREIGIVQSSTFTHSYIKTGTYNPIFTVTDNGGLSAKTSVSVVVTDSSTRACTMEAKQCPDGSYVSRTGPNCEFASCPGATPGGSGH